MNRRSFMKIVFGSAITAVSFQSLAWGKASRFLEIDERADSDIKDLVLWAPFQPFLPDNPDQAIDDPNDGTQTGILKAEDIIKGQSLTLPFWHGHNGTNHEFTITPDHFTSLKSGNPVIIYVPTTVVEDHFHRVIIDPKRVAT